MNHVSYNEILDRFFDHAWRNAKPLIQSHIIITNIVRFKQTTWLNTCVTIFQLHRKCCVFCPTANIQTLNVFEPRSLHESTSTDINERFFYSKRFMLTSLKLWIINLWSEQCQFQQETQLWIFIPLKSICLQEPTLYVQRWSQIRLQKESHCCSYIQENNVFCLQTLHILTSSEPGQTGN